MSKKVLNFKFNSYIINKVTNTNAVKPRGYFHIRGIEMLVSISIKNIYLRL